MISSRTFVDVAAAVVFCLAMGGSGLAGEELPADTPEQAGVRKALAGKGYIYVPQKNQLSRINADGTDLRVIWKSEGGRDKITLCRVSWDGSLVAFAVTPHPSVPRIQELWLVKHDGTDAKKILERPWSSWFTRLYCAWMPDSTWLVVSNGPRVDAIHTETGEVKEVLKVPEGEGNRKSGVAYLSSDLQGNFYFWSQNIKGNAFSLDKDCKLSRELFNCGMKTTCQPSVSPNGKLMARHDHDYELNNGRKRGYITEKPTADEKTSYRFRWLPANEDMPLLGTHNMPFWSPDGAYIGFAYQPDAELLAKTGFKTGKKYSVVAVCSSTGGPMVWLMPATAHFPSWGPVPTSTEQE